MTIPKKYTDVELTAQFYYYSLILHQMQIFLQITHKSLTDILAIITHSVPGYPYFNINITK